MSLLKPNLNHTIKRLGSPSPRALSIGVKAIVVVIILLCGYAISAWIKSNAPQADLRPPEVSAPYVETAVLKITTRPVKMELFGTVIPKTQVDLKARVAGEIVAVNAEFIEGGIILQNTEIARIDPKDYQLAVQAQKAQVATASYNLKLEEGQQIVAQNEWELLKDSEAFQKVQNTDLALRKPHLEKAKADLAAAQAALTQAELNLNRTKLTLPFNALVLSKNANLGSYVNAQDNVAVLTDVSAYHVQASLAANHLQWLRLPANGHESGSNVTIYYNGGRAINGNLIKIMGDLEQSGRMARVLIEVKDPLNLTQPGNANVPLLLGEYVRIELEGAEAENIIVIDRHQLHDNDTVWLVNNGRLEIAPVNVLWRGRNEIYITNTELNGREIITTNLPAPIHNMQIRQDVRLRGNNNATQQTNGN